MAKPRGLSGQVRLRRERLDQVYRAIADGLFEAGKEIILTASSIAPDSPYMPYPTGEGLPKQGGVLAYVDNGKVNGWSIRGGQPKKPRAARAGTKKHTISVIAGFGFPARFAEVGTIDTAAQPFLAPSVSAVQPEIPAIMARVAKREIGGNR